MKNTPNLKAERHRIVRGALATTSSMGNNGLFVVPCCGHELTVIISDGGGWDHVSVSLPYRCPTWDEMRFVQALFFKDDEWAMQLGPPRSENISFHDYCLHWWRPQTADEFEALKAAHADDDYANYEWTQPGSIPLPPSVMVGPRV